MHIGIAADHGGFTLKNQLAGALRDRKHTVVDFGANHFNSSDDYPDFIIPLSQAVAARRVERGIAICGSGVGAAVAANKVADVRAGLIHDIFSARQGVEDDDLNVCCFGGKVIGVALALELLTVFLEARFSEAPRHRRRLQKIHALESTAYFEVTMTETKIDSPQYLMETSDESNAKSA